MIDNSLKHVGARLYDSYEELILTHKFDDGSTLIEAFRSDEIEFD